MKDSAVIGLVGEKGSGKGTVAQYIVRKYHASHYQFSDPLNDALKRFHLPNTRENLVQLALFLREHFGGDILGSILFVDVQNDPAPIIVLDGIRYWDEVKILSKLPKFVLVSVSAPAKKRFERVIVRGEKADESKLTYEEFMKEHEFETEREIPEIMKKAKWFLKNHNGFPELFEQIEEFMRKFQNGSL